MTNDDKNQRIRQLENEVASLRGVNENTRADIARACLVALYSNKNADGVPPQEVVDAIIYTVLSMESARREIERNKWRPIEEASVGQVVVYLTNYGSTGVGKVQKDGEVWRDCACIVDTTHFRPIPTDTLARMAEVLLEALYNISTRQVYETTEEGIKDADIQTMARYANLRLAECAKIAEKANNG